MTTIVGFDPALRSCGLAVIADDVLVAAKRVVRLTRSPKPEIGHAIDLMAVHAMAVWLVVRPSADPPDVLVYELPQVYGGPQSADPNDLIALGMVASAFARELRPKQIIAVTPREWTAGTKKSKTGDAWESVRGRRIRALLTPPEIARVGEPAQHDTLDAVGLALHATTRALARPQRVIARR